MWFIWDTLAPVWCDVMNPRIPTRAYKGDSSAGANPGPEGVAG